MKSCPECHTQYTDDSLRYCLQDGTPLAWSTASDSSTTRTEETQTIVRSRHTGDQYETKREYPATADEASPRPAGGRRQPNTARTAAVTAMIMLLVFGAIGLAGFLYYRASKGSTVRTAVNVNTAGDSNGNVANTKPSPSPSATASPSPSESPTPAVEKKKAVDAQTQAEVTEQIEGWRIDTESFEIDSLLDRYAPAVDYYTRRGVSRDAIRADKERAFSRYDSIRFRLSNFSFSANESAGTVTAVFDKEWRFDGESRSTGKVQQMLILRKSGDRWLITSERDLKVY